MLYCDAATFCRRRNDAGIMTDETGRRCAQESIDITIMKNNYNYLFIIKIILITYLYGGYHDFITVHPLWRAVESGICHASLPCVLSGRML